MEEHQVVQMAERSIREVNIAMERLKEFITQHPFETTDNEIQFFKQEKPLIQEKLFYYMHIFRIESARPTGSRKMQKRYLQRELNRTDRFFEDNREFCQYCRSGSVLLDEQFFTRNNPGFTLFMEPRNYFLDPSFHTSHDTLLAELYANEHLSRYIGEQIELLRKRGKQLVSKVVSGTKEITWTATKAGLIELVYALYSCGAYNNGNADVKDIATHFEQAYNIDLGNFYRSFQEIRIRKKSRTSFLDQLKEKLERRMDETDENPRY